MKTIMATMWPYLRRYKKLVCVAIAAMLGEVVTQLLAPWPLKFIFDSVLFKQKGSQLVSRQPTLAGRSLHLLVLFSAAALAIAIFDAVFTYLDERVSEVVAQRSIYDLRLTLFSHLQRLSMAFHQHEDTRVGDLLARLSGDIQTLEDLAANGVSNFVTNGLALVAMAGVMYWLDWRLATLALVSTIPMFMLAKRTTRRMRVASRAARRQEGQVSAVLAESLTAIKLVQAYGREEYEERRLALQSSKSLEANLEAAAVQARLSPLLGVVGTVGLSGVTAVGVVLVLRGQLTPGELLIALGYLRGLQSPIRQLAKLSFSIGKASAGMERIRESLERTPQVDERPGAKELARAAGKVRFQNVTFGYRKGEEVLKSVNIDILPGMTVALVGQTGSGKSTLVSLLTRFYDPWKGRVLIDNHDVRDLTLRSLRDQISLVLQDSLIFRTTVRENIAYGRPNATNAEIEEAAAIAGVAAIASHMEDGLDTIVSERGASLSGGQKQCIAIARAILRDSPIVVLDEPTSSMDSNTEKLVMDGIRRLTRGRTVIVIAHRLATVRDADMVIVLSDGKIIEQGTPKALLRRGAVFASLASAQALTLPEQS
jgi:ATP-binding cassette subfamily B protein/subfamily B ATP-binding cassette protein MsbA